MSRAEFRARVGVDCITPDLLDEAFARLPIGSYRDYHGLGWAHVDAEWGQGFEQPYVPEIQYKGIGDTPEAHDALREAAASGFFPVPVGVELDACMDLLELGGLESWLVDGTRDGAFAPGTWFLLGNEPGYSRHDPRTPAEIVDDAERVRAIFERHALDHRLVLGGLSSPDTAYSRSSYGMRPLEFFEAIVRAAERRGVVFDAYAIHPYPMSRVESPDDLRDLPAAQALVADSVRQVRAMRELLATLGQRDAPLWITEVGVPFPGAGSERVSAYLDGFLTWSLTTTDADIGNRADGGRLVQRFQWFLLAEPSIAVPGYTDNPIFDLGESALLDAQGEPTELGRRLRAVADRLAPL